MCEMTRTEKNAYERCCTFLLEMLEKYGVPKAPEVTLQQRKAA